MTYVRNSTPRSHCEQLLRPLRMTMLSFEWHRRVYMILLNRRIVERYHVEWVMPLVLVRPLPSIAFERIDHWENHHNLSMSRRYDVTCVWKSDSWVIDATASLPRALKIQAFPLVFVCDHKPYAVVAMYQVERCLCVVKQELLVRGSTAAFDLTRKLWAYREDLRFGRNATYAYLFSTVNGEHKTPLLFIEEAERSDDIRAFRITCRHPAMDCLLHRRKPFCLDLKCSHIFSITSWACNQQSKINVSILHRFATFVMLCEGYAHPCGLRDVEHIHVLGHVRRAQRHVERIFQRYWIPIGSVVTHIHGAKVLHEATVVHPKNAVVRTYKLKLLYKFGCPFWRAVTPVTRPFPSSPWVTKLQKTLAKQRAHVK